MIFGLLKLSFLKRNSFVVSAGANLNQLILWCKTKGLSGLENLVSGLKMPSNENEKKFEQRCVRIFVVK